MCEYTNSELSESTYASRCSLDICETMVHFAAAQISSRAVRSSSRQPFECPTPLLKSTSIFFSGPSKLLPVIASPSRLSSSPSEVSPSEDAVVEEMDELPDNDDEFDALDESKQLTRGLKSPDADDWSVVEAPVVEDSEAGREDEESLSVPLKLPLLPCVLTVRFIKPALPKFAIFQVIIFQACQPNSIILDSSLSPVVAENKYISGEL